MKRTICISLLAFTCAAVELRAQLKINLDNIAAKASETVDLALDAQMLQIAGRFLSPRKPDEAKAKELISGLKGVYVKSFEFDKGGQFSQADLKPVRAQLEAPGWSRVVSVLSNRDREGTEIFLKTEAGKTAGLVILAYEPTELTVVNIVGPIDLEQLSELGGHFGIPTVEIPPAKKKAPK